MEQNLSLIETIILDILEAHRGKDQAIARPELVDRVHAQMPFANDREIRERIKHLVRKHGLRIGSCFYGYFLVQTAEELQGVCKYYRSYALTMLSTEAQLRKVHLKELLGQMTMEL